MTIYFLTIAEKKKRVLIRFILKTLSFYLLLTFYSFTILPLDIKAITYW